MNEPHRDIQWMVKGRKESERTIPSRPPTPYLDENRIQQDDHARKNMVNKGNEEGI